MKKGGIGGEEGNRGLGGEMQTVKFVSDLFLHFDMLAKVGCYLTPFPILSCGLFLHPINDGHTRTRTNTVHFCHTDGGKDIKMILNYPITLLLLYWFKQ